jgi:hypothetical protein
MPAVRRTHQSLMLDFNTRTDRQLLDTLESIEADPSQFVPEARDEALRVLAARHGTLSVSAIAAQVAEAEAKQEARLDWIDRTGTGLARGRPFVPSDAPDTAAAAEALRDAIKFVRLSVIGEVLLVLCVPALVVLGILEAVAPESSILVPFNEMRHLPYLRYIGVLPTAMAALLSVAFGLFAPSTAVLVLGAVFGAILLSALWHVAYRFRHLRHLNQLLRDASGA